MSFEDSGPVVSSDRLPPNDPMAEKSVVGVLLADGDAFGALTKTEAILAGNSMVFYDLKNRAIYEAVLQMFEQKKPIGLVSVDDHLRKAGLIDEIGGTAYLASLFSDHGGSGSASIEYHVQILVEKWKARQLIQYAGDAAAKAYSGQGEIDMVIDELGSWAVQCGISKKASVRPVKDVCRNLIDQFQRERKGVYDGVIRSSLADFDRRFLGFTRKELTIIAARPSIGKTALMLQCAREIARNEIPVGIVSLEMSSESLTRRMVGSAAGVNLRHIERFSDHQMTRLAAEMMRLAETPIYIDDRPGLPIREIKNVARQLVAERKISILMVDYLGLAKGSSKRSELDRTLEVAEISAGLKEIAKELDIAVVSLCQLNREVEKRTAGRPKLSDLKESGAIEQDADMVVFLWNPAEKESDIEARIDGPSEAVQINISLAKNRNGQTGDVEMVFMKGTQRFEPVAKISVPEEYYEQK